jgi:hypothetical protein
MIQDAAATAAVCSRDEEMKKKFLPEAGCWCRSGGHASTARGVISNRLLNDPGLARSSKRERNE